MRVQMKLIVLLTLAENGRRGRKGKGREKGYGLRAKGYGIRDKGRGAPAMLSKRHNSEPSPLSCVGFCGRCRETKHLLAIIITVLAMRQSEAWD